MFCKLDFSLRKFVTIEKGKKVLYTQLDKALYRCIQSAILWYKLYSTTLIEMGFTSNPTIDLKLTLGAEHDSMYFIVCMMIVEAIQMVLCRGNGEF